MLSLSGQAPRLPDAEIESLLVQAAEKDGKAAQDLAGFYCDLGQYEKPATPCVYPDKARRYLTIAAKSGVGSAINQLGVIYERGELGPVDIDRARSCYQLAAKRGNTLAIGNLQRIGKSSDSNPTLSTRCDD